MVSGEEHVDESSPILVADSESQYNDIASTSAVSAPKHSKSHGFDQIKPDGCGNGKSRMDLKAPTDSAGFRWIPNGINERGTRLGRRGATLR